MDDPDTVTQTDVGIDRDPATEITRFGQHPTGDQKPLCTDGGRQPPSEPERHTLTEAVLTESFPGYKDQVRHSTKLEGRSATTVPAAEVLSEQLAKTSTTTCSVTRQRHSTILTTMTTSSLPHLHPLEKHGFTHSRSLATTLQILIRLHSVYIQ